MSKTHKKEWNQIGKITEEWVKASYPKASVVDSWKYKDRINGFLEFLGITDKEFIETYKRAKDRIEWSRKIGFKVVAYYNERVRSGKATNTARAEVSTVRAFCRDNCTILIVPRRKIAKAKASHGEHEFSLIELQKIFHVSGILEKAIVSTAISLGFHVEDFSELKRADIEPLVNKAIEQKIDFIGFDFERTKTGVKARSHLTPEARDSLKAWFDYTDQKRESEGKQKSEWVWCNGNGNHLIDKTFNSMVKELCKKANIITTGKIRFALFRKFLMGALQDANFNSFLIKRAIGKEVPTSDSTYLQHLDRQLDEKFSEMYPFIRLNGTIQSRTHLEDLEAKVLQLEVKLESYAIENQTLKRIIQYSIPKETLSEIISKIAKENNIEIAKYTGSPISLEELLEMLKAKTQKPQA
jgi:hypothetical protein